MRGSRYQSVVPKVLARGRASSPPASLRHRTQINEVGIVEERDDRELPSPPGRVERAMKADIGRLFLRDQILFTGGLVGALVGAFWLASSPRSFPYAYVILLPFVFSWLCFSFAVRRCVRVPLVSRASCVVYFLFRVPLTWCASCVVCFRVVCLLRRVPLASWAFV